MSPEKAEILGLLCAEGTHYKYQSSYLEFFKNRGINGKYYRRTKIIEAIEFTNLNQALLEHFRDLMSIVYDYSPRPTGVKNSMKIRITKNAVISDLLKYTDFGCKKWTVPKEIPDSEADIIASFLSGIFDGDGSFRERDIRLVSVNGNGLKSVSILLSLIGIESWVNGPYKGRGNRRSHYYHFIPKRSIIKYKDLIYSNHNEKMEILNSLGS